MKRLFILLLILIMAPGLSYANDSREAYIIEINGVIGPATADYFSRSLETATQANATFLLIRLDTPGGLDLSMRDMIKQIISSPIPVVTYVSPGGARAASAGTYLLYASHIAAMAPATNLGAATPVQIKPGFGGEPEPLPGQKPTDNKEKQSDNTTEPDTMKRKITNDAVAYIRGLADLRGRNVDWAEKAVREAASLTAEAALKQKVIDIVANSERDLMQQLNGRTVEVLGTKVELDTTNVIFKELKPDWRNKVLEVITNPNIAYILMMIGIYGLIFEFANPGSIAPGTIGAICLLLALFSFQILPINYAGLALIFLGIALMVAEAFQPSFGVLGLGGVAAFVVGSIILIDTDLPGYGISLGVIAGFSVSTVAFFIMALGMVIRTRRHPIVSGMEEMIGAMCVVQHDFERQGTVRVHSENWTARCDVPMKQGERAIVKAIDGLILEIVPVKAEEKSS